MCPRTAFLFVPSPAAAPIQFSWLFSMVDVDCVRMLCPKLLPGVGSKLWAGTEAHSWGSENEGASILDQFSWKVQMGPILQTSALKLGLLHRQQAVTAMRSPPC